MTELQHLGKQSQDPIERIETVPWEGSYTTVRLEATEFTSFCPVTGQPDFGELQIQYSPRGKLIETKSLKLFLWSFRERRAFNEALVEEIAMRLCDDSEAYWVRVTGHFHPRGGISVHPECMVHARDELGAAMGSPATTDGEGSAKR